jgi:16S rRNA processing protein RimM
MSDITEEFITIGRVLGPWGLKGRIKVNPMTDFPERFDEGATVYIEEFPYIVERTEWHKGNALVKLKHIETVDEAEEFIGKFVEISPAQVRPLPAGQYYHYQIVGLNVVTGDGREIGVVTDVLTSSANDIYVVEGKDGEVLIPATEDIIKSIDVEKKMMIIEALPGLLDLNKKTGKEKE